MDLAKIGEGCFFKFWEGRDAVGKKSGGGTGRAGKGTKSKKWGFL